MEKDDQDTGKNWKDLTGQAGEVAKNIWLAGLGAYGRAYDEIHEVYEQASKDSPKLFRELVEKGKKLEEQARRRFSDTAVRGSTAAFEERLHKMRAAFGFGPQVSREDFERLEQQVEALSKKVEALAGKQAPKKQRKPPRKAPTRRKSPPSGSATE